MSSDRQNPPTDVRGSRLPDPRTSRELRAPQPYAGSGAARGALTAGPRAVEPEPDAQSTSLHGPGHPLRPMPTGLDPMLLDVITVRADRDREACQFATSEEVHPRTTRPGSNPAAHLLLCRVWLGRAVANANQARHDGLLVDEAHPQWSAVRTRTGPLWLTRDGSTSRAPF